MSALPRPTARHVLIVDHERHEADTLSLFFTAMGYAVRKCYRTSDAVAICEAFPPDIALVDVCSPGLDGIELARYLRERRREAVLIVGMTLKGASPDRERSREAGIDHLFMKSADLDLLLSFVAHRRPAAHLRLV
jgi:DNA-binding response OmpR family regulator